MAQMRVDPDKVHEFKDARGFERWLARHWDKETEVWIKIHKVKSGLPSITPAEAIDVVLCWGWIDGIRKGLDEQSFLQRYSPRGKKSVWSQVNVANVARLTKEGRMRPSGLAQVEAAKADGRWATAYAPQRSAAVPEDLVAALADSDRARVAFQALGRGDRYAIFLPLLKARTPAGRAGALRRAVATLEAATAAER